MVGDWFDAATAGNTEYLEENIDLLGGSTTETGCSGLIRAIYAHKLASVEVLAACEYKIPDISSKYPLEIALKLYYYDACFILLMLHPEKSFENRVKALKGRYISESITKKELNIQLGELVSEFVAGIRDGTLSLGCVSRVSSVDSEDVHLTPKEHTMQSLYLDDAENDSVKENTDEQDASKQSTDDKCPAEENDISSSKEEEEKELVDSEYDVKNSDEEKTEEDKPIPSPRKARCCRCL